MRRVCFLAALVFFASLNSSAEVAACPVKFRHEHRCHYHPVVPKGESPVEKAKREAQKIIDDAKRDAQKILDDAKHEADDIKARATTEAETIRATAQRDADNLRASAQRDAETAKASAQREVDNIIAKANRDAENIKANALHEKQEAQALMTAAVATQKAAADQIEKAKQSQLEFDSKTQELKDKIKEAEDAKRKADGAQEAFGQAKHDLEELKKKQVAHFEKIITKVNEPDVIFLPNPAVPPPGVPLCCGDPGKAAGNCCQTKEP